MSILNVNQIQPVGGGNTITVTASDVSASGATITASRFVGEFSSGLNVTGGSVGIGTDNPSTKLEVTGDITITNGTQENAIRTNSAGQLQFMRNSASNNQVAMTINDEDGNIGIATANPSDHNNFSRALDINGPSGAAVYMRTAGSSTNTFIVGNYGSEAYLNNVANGNIRFYTQGDERFRITSAGRVGIGTDNPAGNLEIDAASTTDMIMLDVAGTNFAKIGHNSASGTDILDVRSEGHTRFLTNGNNERLRITSGGTLDFKTADGVGINFRESGYINIDSDNDDSNRNFSFYDAKDTGSQKLLMILTDTGNIGIGTNVLASSSKLTLFEESGNAQTLEIIAKNAGGAGSQPGIKFTANNGDNIGGIYGDVNSDKLKIQTGGTDRVVITGIGSFSIGQENPFNRLHVEDNGASISATGDAILNSTQKGIRLRNPSNDDTSLGLWFTTGDSHHSGITGQRNDSANTWGTDLRFYTHEDATNDLTYTRERLRINPHGLLINRKGNNAVDTGGTILGRYKYAQQNQGSGVAHLILGADGRKLQDYIDTNCYCIITVCVTGTGTNNMFCQYYYHANSSSSSSTLVHLYGNSGGSSNRPYMNLQNTHDPAWLMSHSGGYIQDIEVAVYGGSWGRTATKEYGWFTSNP